MAAMSDKRNLASRIRSDAWFLWCESILHAVAGATACIHPGFAAAYEEL